jgi:hypothetical protein
MGKKIPMNSKDLSDHSLDPVPANGSPELSVNTDSQPAAARLVGHVHQSETCSLPPFSAPVHLLKFTRFSQQALLGEPIAHHLLHGQPFSSLGPSAFDHRLTCPGAHSEPKAMGTLTFDIAGLKCLFTHCVFLLCFTKRCRATIVPM